MLAGLIEHRARALARAHGHKDTDAEIVCAGGTRQPVWKFYRDEALEQVERDLAANPNFGGKLLGPETQ